MQNYSLPITIDKGKFQLEKDKIIIKKNKRNALSSNDFEVKKKNMLESLLCSLVMERKIKFL